MEASQYLRDKITEAGLTCRLNNLSCTIILKHPIHCKLIKRWKPACKEDIMHILVMPTIITNKDKIHKFLEELVKEISMMKIVRIDSPLAKLQISAWGG